MIGRVVSVKTAKTAIVLSERRKTHPLYGKSFLRSKRYPVDDPLGVSLGQIVEFVKVSPVSKTKHWRIIKLLGQDAVALGEEAMKQVAEEAIEEALPEKEKSNKELQDNIKKIRDRQSGLARIKAGNVAKSTKKGGARLPK